MGYFLKALNFYILCNKYDIHILVDNFETVVSRI